MSSSERRFRCFFESTMPDVDDTIHIHSTLNVTSSVQFSLNFNQNSSRNVREYKAEFTPESASEFLVTPKAGLLSVDNPAV